jgi:hypothetical protein
MGSKIPFTQWVNTKLARTLMFSRKKMQGGTILLKKWGKGLSTRI